MSSVSILSDRKAQLIARCDLQRLQAELAFRDVRRIVSPPPQRGSRARSAAATMIGFALPFLGAGRLRRIVRVVSVGFMAFRALRGWRSR